MFTWTVRVWVQAPVRSLAFIIDRGGVWGFHCRGSFWNGSLSTVSLKCKRGRDYSLITARCDGDGWWKLRVSWLIATEKEPLWGRSNVIHLLADRGREQKDEKENDSGEKKTTPAA